MISLADILPASLAALDVAPDNANFSIPKSKRVVVFLVDGLGLQNLISNQGIHPIIDDLIQNCAQSSLPSTTPVSLATFGTGMNPGEHGFVGATMFLPETNSILQPLKWETEPNPKNFQPLETLFEKAEKKYVEVKRIGPSAYEHSGLTNAVLRGGEYLFAENLEDIAQVTSKVLHSSFPSLTYVYYPQLDRVGHVHGVDSDEWRQELISVLNCIEKIKKELPRETSLIITADHGMVDVDKRVWIEDFSSITNNVGWITGEPRFRHFFARENCLKKLENGLSGISDFAQILSRDELIESRLLGEFVDEHKGRVGDFVAIAHDLAALCSRTIDSRVSNLIGQHGGNTDTERDIPVAVLAG